MSKLGAHIVQGGRNGYGNFCTAKPAVILSTNDGGALLEAWQKSGGHTYTIFRDTTLYKDAPGGIDQMTPAQASLLADSIYPTLKAKWAQNPADYYTALNEPAGNNAQIAPSYFAYELRMMELAEADGLKLCVLNLAGGTPGDLDVWKSLYVPHIERAFEGGHIYGRHCYGGGKLSTPDGNTNRAFIEAEHLRVIGLGYGGIVITEAGHNGGYAYIGDAAFVADVQAYNAQMMTHPNIIGACLWTLGEWQTPSSNWQTAIPTLSPLMASNHTPKWTPGDTPPPQPPTGYKSVVYKLAQEHTADEWAGIARLAYADSKRTMTASGDNCLVMVQDGNTESYAVIFDPSLPSQVATIQQFTAAGIRYQTRVYRDTTPPPTIPAGVDLLPYIKGDGRLYEVRHSSGGQERFQTQVKPGGVFWQTKNGQYEELAADDTYIWRGLDISPGPAPSYAERPGVLRYYTAKEAGKERARWCKRIMAIGETFAGPGHHVQFFYRDNCQPSAANSGNATNKTKLVAKHASKTWNGITVNDVIEMTNGTETWYFARGFGLVAWSSTWGNSAISEVHQPGARPDNVTDTGCWS